MRGKVLQNLISQGIVGITPAYAGKSCRWCHHRRTAWDHPRVCGEKREFYFYGQRIGGSPPRVRGKVSVPASCPGGRRITPAHAGKSQLARARLPADRDHPRACGEKRKKFCFVLRYLGSPPRMRGKAQGPVQVQASARITPACAGKSLRSAISCLLVVGSPPRMWGKAVSPARKHRPAGITPAYAGKSSIQHLTASLGEFKVQKGHPVPHLRQRLQVWPDHARHLRHGLILHASLSAGQGRRLCPGPCPDTAGSGTPRGPSPAKRPHTSPPAATPGGCRAWQSDATAPGSR